MQSQIQVVTLKVYPSSQPMFNPHTVVVLVEGVGVTVGSVISPKSIRFVLEVVGCDLFQESQIVTGIAVTRITVMLIMSIQTIMFAFLHYSFPLHILNYF